MNDSYKLECRYNYTRMNAAEKRLYLFMVERILKRELRFYYISIYAYDSFFTSENQTIDETLPVFTYDFDDYIDVAKVYDGIIWDWPELFYIARSELTVESEYLLAIGGGVAEYTDEEIGEINARLAEILHKFDDIQGEFELELAVHDYIINDYDYDFENSAYAGREHRELFTVVGLLKRHKGVCGGLSLLMQYVLQQRGILVANIVSAPTEEYESHSWLIVRINGAFYHVDLTFDEDCSKALDEPQYTHFNVTDDEIMTDHNYAKAEYPDLPCSSTADNYYHKKGLFFASADEACAAISNFIQANRLSQGQIPFYFRMKDDLSAGAIDQAIPKIAQKKVRSYTFSHNEDGYFAFLFDFVN